MSKCELWLGSTDVHGYGRFWFSGKFIRAHRFIYELVYGAIPKNLCVLHRCDVRNCVNPKHLWLGTLGDNNRDTFSKGRNPNAGGIPGERKGNTRLTEQQVREIRSDSRFQRLIAKDYRISQTHVSQIKNRTCWSFLN